MTHPNSCVTVGDGNHKAVTRDASTNIYQQKARTHSQSKHTPNTPTPNRFIKATTSTTSTQQTDRSISMAQFGQDQRDVGTLSISDIDTNGTYTFDFIPNLDKVPDHLDRDKIPEKATLAHVNPEQQRIMIYPINTLSDNPNFLKPKYSKIRTIILEGTIYPTFEGWYDSDFHSPSLDNPIELLLDCLPKGFIRDYHYGLGLTQEGNFIINEITNATNVNTIIFNDTEEIEIKDTILHFSLCKYHDIIDEIKRIARRGQRATWRVKQNFAYNTLAPLLKLDPKDCSLGRLPDSKQITLAAADHVENVRIKSDDTPFPSSDFSSELRKLKARSPEALPELRRDVELVSLEELISNFEAYLKGRHQEKYWQKFFKKNLFALQQVFGMPTTLFRDEVTVGGRDFTGSGDKIVDFMFKNTLTDNIALVEIKLPEMPLLDPKEYRKGVYGPHKKLNDAITQALDQCFHLQSELPTLKNNARRYDLESYNIRCIVIAGRTPSDDNDKKKSLELFRNNLRSVTIVTYDEILESLKTLQHFLSNEDDQEK